MTIFKLELIEGPELYYANVFEEGILIASSVEALKDPAPLLKCFMLQPGESITVNAKHMYIGIGK